MLNVTENIKISIFNYNLLIIFIVYKIFHRDCN